VSTVIVSSFRHDDILNTSLGISSEPQSVEEGRPPKVTTIQLPSQHVSTAITPDHRATPLCGLVCRQGNLRAAAPGPWREAALAIKSALKADGHRCAIGLTTGEVGRCRLTQ